ncbi:FliH/SctL family protein [Nesterenkonia populi]|uniref:FliH/SctL family protein n=1 Tax=Nesterenkonia populi TaxID=1591087 RepID=UPI00147949A1|nr:FliH/SctL family protein [Nesterenkonia populi]
MSAEQAALTPLSFATLGGAVVDTQDIEAERARARTQGYSAGYAAGARVAAEQARAQQAEHARRLQAQREQAQAEHDAELAALTNAADALASRTLEAVQAVDRSLTAAALELAEAILGAELKDGRHCAESALRRVLENTEPEDVRAVRMNPREARLIAEQAQQAGVRAAADPALAPGDAVADLAEGFLDARISTALQRCREALASPGGSSAQPEAAA